MLSDGSSPEVKFEIGHVLFIDIVGYSKLLITEQSDLLRKLKDIVRATEQFKVAEAAGKLLRLPTGDGGALVFRDSPEAPALCALEIAQALQSHPELPVRMGVHSGPVNEITDLNEQANIAGAGINIAQRIMDCGDAGHILLSKHVADDLEHYPQWRSQLHDLGECEVKHGLRLQVVNLYHGDLGNPARPQKLGKGRKQAAASSSSHKSLAIALIAIVLIAGAGFAFFARHRSAEVSAPPKSIAVLPFENLSADPGNAYFAEGIQDEILTRLSKIADLKVISRTSTQHYKSAPENLPDIARQLGVANILEGSVQKSGEAVRVTVQLIRDPNDATAHHWFGNTLLANVGRFDDAVAEGKRSIELDPLSLINNADLGSTLIWARRYDEAIAQLRRTLLLDPNFSYTHWNLGEALYHKGDLPGAIAELEKARSLDREDGETLGVLGLTYAKAGRKEDAWRILGELKELAARSYVHPAIFSIIYIGLGDKDKAVQFLEGEVGDEYPFDFTDLKVDPLLDPLRDDPRFQQLVAKVMPK